MSIFSESFQVTEMLCWKKQMPSLNKGKVISVNCIQVSKNGKHLPQFCVLQSARDNDDANIALTLIKLTDKG